jgi:hypothetical protein
LPVLGALAHLVAIARDQRKCHLLPDCHTGGNPNPQLLEKKPIFPGKLPTFATHLSHLKQTIRDHEQLRIDGDFYPCAL